MHDERQKKAFLKKESRKVSNLLESSKYDGDSSQLALASGGAEQDLHLSRGLAEQSSIGFTVTDFLATNRPD